jgi:hypothetical protein
MFTLSPASRARSIFLIIRSWGLRPRLYAVARFASFPREFVDVFDAVLFHFAIFVPFCG